MSYKLILCWDDDEEDQELCEYVIPVTLGEHVLDHIYFGGPAGAHKVTLTATVEVHDG